jgi:antitoxin component YwqK of YwqJK toxin-antitoxin module
MKRLLIVIVFLAVYFILNNPAFSNNPQDKNCDQTNCTECEQIFPERGETDYSYKNGKLDGIQKIYYKNGKLSEEMIYKNGKPDGLTKLYFKDGQLWETKIYREGLLLDSNNQPMNRIYKRYYKNGQLAAEGLYKDGLPQGEYKNYYENGVIEAFYDYVHPEEFSLKTYAKNGRIKFQGGYLNGQYDGKHVLYFDNGKPQFEMTFRKGVPLGDRKDYLENGALKDEYKYLDGKNKWEYVEYSENGKIKRSGTYAGETPNVKAIGATKEFYDNGKLKDEFNYHDSKLDKWEYIEYYENGKIKKSGTYTGETPNVKAEGVIKEFYENGQLKDEMLSKNDIPTGIRKNYAENGTLEAEYKYPNGYNKWEYVLYYEDGKELSSGIYSGGNGSAEMKLDGAYKKYYKNGQLKLEVNYKNNEKDGIQRTYLSDGALSGEMTFKGGVNQAYLEIEKKDNDLLKENEKIRKSTGGMTFKEIFKKAKTVYKSLATYKAKGTVITTWDSGKEQNLFHTHFNLVLKKPNLYLISWTQQTPWRSDSGAVWDDGSHPYLYMEYSEAYQQMSNDELALAGATGISEGSAYTIPSIFLTVFKHDFAIMDKLINPKIEGEQKINGENCYVISGTSKYSDSERLWISKSRFIIVKYSQSFDLAKGIKLTDKEIERIIKHMGKKSAEDFKKQIREDLNKSQQIQGVSTQIYNDISFPELNTKDFKFKLPKGVVLKKSLFEGELDNKK